MNQTRPVEAASNQHAARSGHIACNGVNLYYVDEGPLEAPPLVLVMGLGCQLTVWPEALVTGLVEAGFRVIRFDNRDIGLSDQIRSPIRVNLPKAMVQSRLRQSIKSAYTLHDMANDVVALLDGLGIEKTHIAGASMGGMISQLFAATYPHRTLSLTSIMSTTNEPGLPMPRWDIMLHMTGIGVKKGHDRDTAVERSLTFWQKVGSPAFPTDVNLIRDRMGRDFDRSYRPTSYLRQTHAILATGGFSHQLHRISCPTQVIHGTDDPLVSPKGGKASAKSIAGAKLEMIEGMGHDFPLQLVPRFIELIEANARKAG